MSRAGPRLRQRLARSFPSGRTILLAAPPYRSVARILKDRACTSQTLAVGLLLDYLGQGVQAARGGGQMRGRAASQLELGHGFLERSRCPRRVVVCGSNGNA